MGTTRKTRAPAKRSARKRDTLEELRARIDELDAKVLGHLGERYRVVEAILKAKQRDGTPVYQPDRERSQLARLERLNRQAGTPVQPAAVEAIFREILSASRALQGAVAVAYLGPPGTYSERAAREQFGSSAELLPVGSIPEVFRTVERTRAAFGVVPIENSTEGMVGQTLDAFVQSPLRIVAERQLQIRHALLARSAGLAGIRLIVSHPQSLAQCREWLATNAPGIPTREVASNAAAAEAASRSRTTAAIAGEEAGRLYGLKVLADGIQDVPHNVTRFLVVAAESAVPPGASDKISVLFSVKNEPGMLYRSLKPLAANGIDLFKIESRPLRGRIWDYLFFADFAGEMTDPRVKRAMNAMKRHCVWFKVLGSYPAARVP
ncbi:MAG: prephenate dehydratase [Deltaproteobacteria bacterium]|nr:prephenate dehydratase [Deltaproteobacteria bacterium]